MTNINNQIQFSTTTKSFRLPDQCRHMRFIRNLIRSSSKQCYAIRAPTRVFRWGREMGGKPKNVFEITAWSDSRQFYKSQVRPGRLHTLAALMTHSCSGARSISFSIRDQIIQSPHISLFRIYLSAQARGPA